MTDDEEKKKAAEAKKAELRAKLEAEAAGKKKGGFMTPERKKKLRAILRAKAAEELKKEQERKAAERKKTIEDRCGEPKNIEAASYDELLTICEEFHEKIAKFEADQYDVERCVKLLNLQKKELTDQLTARGRYVKPGMKKVPKSFGKLPPKPPEFKFMDQLNKVPKDDFPLSGGGGGGGVVQEKPKKLILTPTIPAK